MTGCRIGNIKMKSGGASIRMIENASHSIEHDTHALGFFVLYKDGAVKSGISYDSGFTISQLRGAVETMKENLIKDIFHD